LFEKKSLYIHVPFCVKKCFYCDFYSVEDPSLHSAYVKALTKEIQLISCSDSEQDNEIDTIYFGGGTPSTLPIKIIEQILSEADNGFKIAKDTETTIEINPGTIDREYISALKSLGFNRLNIGVQSFQDDNLTFLGRVHSAKQAKKVIEFSRNEGFDNLGIDLIYGLPGQDESTWIKDLNKAISYKLEHLSCYMLTFEKNTPLHTKFKQGLIKPVSKEKLSYLFMKTSDYLVQNNYIHYEISNFASDLEHRSKHNLKYWNQKPYLGFGASAHSYDNKKRSWNHSDIKQYTADLNENILPISGKEILSEEQQMIEMIMLGLRTSKGIDLIKFEKYFNKNFLNYFDSVLPQLENERFYCTYNNRFVLTQKGMCYLDNIIKLFVDLV
jgi:putative oxygen-independent coproporphyrinogen III oxidase